MKLCEWKRVSGICWTTLIAGGSLLAADPGILRDGAPPAAAEEPLVADAPGEPPNAAAQVEWDERVGTLRLRYDDKLLFDGRVAGKVKLSSSTTRRKQAVTQMLALTGKGLRLEGVGTGQQ